MQSIRTIIAAVILIITLVSFSQAETNWITKKSDKKTKVEKVKKKITSSWIKKKKAKENKKKLKEKINDSKTWITKKSKDKIKNIKQKLKKHKKIDDLPKADFYFAALVEPNEGEEAQYLYGYVNSDKESELFKFKNKSYYSKSDGIAYFENKKHRCQVDTKLTPMRSAISGDVIIDCKNNKKMSGAFLQIGSVGQGMGEHWNYNSVKFEFFSSKIDAIAQLENYKGDILVASAANDGETIIVRDPPKKRKSIKLKPNGNYYALLIGNSKYDDEGLVDLDSPVNDITAIKKVLDKSYKFKKIITVKNGTKKQIFNAFKELSKLSTTNDYVFIYYSGHGETRAEQAYWIPKDGSSEWGNGDWININELNIFLTEIKAHHLAVMVDSCYVGGKFKGTNVLDVKEDEGRKLWNENLNDELNLRSRSVLSSGSTGRVSDTVAGSNHSRFALSFLNLLKFADKEAVPINLVSIAMNVRAAFQGNMNQKPYYYHPDTWQHGGGDFIFIPKKNLK